MKKFNFPEGDYYLANDRYKESEIPLCKDTSIAAESFFKWNLEKAFSKGDALFKDYIELYARRKGLERTALLEAHGGVSDNRWTYWEKGKEHSIQRWISQKDGKYKAIVLFSCNVGHKTPYSKRSILVMPDRIINAHGDDEFCYDLFVPEIGVITPMTIEHELEQLKDKN